MVFQHTSDKRRVNIQQINHLVCCLLVRVHDELEKEGSEFRNIGMHVPYAQIHTACLPACYPYVVRRRHGPMNVDCLEFVFHPFRFGWHIGLFVHFIIPQRRMIKENYGNTHHHRTAYSVYTHTHNADIRCFGTNSKAETYFHLVRSR